MRRWVFWGLAFCFSLGTQAKQLPLTVKEISLFLRTGYSNSAVIQELSTRRFADTLDATNEILLVQAGANEDLIKALKSGSYSLSAVETAAAQKQIVDQAKRREAEVERSRKFDTLYQDQLAHPRANAPTIQSGNGDAIYQQVKGDLVSCRSGSLTHFDDQAVGNKKLIALYFSAHWCGPCRKFTPQLVDYYTRFAPQHPEFEIIFVSSDKSPAAMETYMHETNMPWPAIDYQKLAAKDAIRKYAGSGIPCLVLVDADGKIISDSFNGKQYLGPQKVLTDLDSIFARGAVAQAH